MNASSGSGRIIAIGDIHAFSIALMTLIEAIGPTPDDRVIPLGDVIDYGPDSRGVIRQLRALLDRTQLTLLTGNHEEMLFNVLDRQWDLESWTRHGGDQTLWSCWPHYSRKTFVVGHAPQTTGRILDLGFAICIDTDCSRGNWLTALDLGTGQYWQANVRAELREGKLDRRTQSHDHEEP